MRIHTDIAELRGIRCPVLTTGTFDGVHRGHRIILERLVARAREVDGESMLFTFHPHPRMVLDPGAAGLKLLSTQEEKTALLRATGLDHLLVVPFSRDFSRMTGEAYVRQVLVGAIGVHAVVIGHDHRFGCDRGGDLALLRRMGPELGFRVEEIPPQEVDHILVSSTQVRQALLRGDVRVANELLGYDYPLSGVVVKGDRIGRTIGFPTANIGAIDPAKLVPAQGIYAVRVRLPASMPRHTLGGMLYIGPRPTLADGAGEARVEVNIFGLPPAFATGGRELYGEPLTVRFVERVRGDRRFDDLEQMRTRMELDRQEAMAMLNDHTA
ncbi:MAG: riboflavin biosynthesis protein RibF [Flavobacteriales bacterium]|jgi:riboflavin kinase/FMN adenylyltransferase|nr:riboflavin biosynthesis protein RibF [Flavobacteriales bacterium]